MRHVRAVTESSAVLRDGITIQPTKTIHIMKPMEPMKPMESMQPMEAMKPMGAGKDRWWPESLGDNPNSAGGQNEMRYAYFGEQHRLAVDTGDGKTVVYDTGDHQVSGVQQAQSGGGKHLVFTSQQGRVDLDKLPKVNG